MYSRFVALQFDLILVLRSQVFQYLRKTRYKHALEHLEAASQENKMVTFSCYGKCVTINDLFEGL